MKTLTNHEQLGQYIGAFVDEKNKAYANSFAKASRILQIMIEGMTPEEVVRALPDIVTTARSLDKMIRIIRNAGKGGDAMKEDPKIDKLGYDLLDLLHHYGGKFEVTDGKDLETK